MINDLKNLYAQYKNDLVEVEPRTWAVEHQVLISIKHSEKFILILMYKKYFKRILKKKYFKKT